MIPPNELRIGNLLQYEFQAVSVDIVSKNGFAVSGDEIYPAEEDTDNVEPIPLTHEWLIRFGAIFPYEDNRVQIGSLCFYWNGKKLYLNDSGWQEEIGEYPIATVHHLQNLAFYFTGTELTLKP